MEKSSIERLEAKSAEEAIMDRIGYDFNLAPFMARIHFVLALRKKGQDRVTVRG
jgi:hypothetical protein